MKERAEKYVNSHLVTLNEIRLEPGALQGFRQVNRKDFVFRRSTEDAQKQIFGDLNALTVRVKFEYFSVILARERTFAISILHLNWRWGEY